MSEKLITLSNLSEFRFQFDQTLNHRGFITKAVNDLTYYYLKSETYTKAEVQALIAAVKQFTYEVATQLPAASAETMYTLYLVPATGGSGSNVKAEYITVRSGQEGSYTYAWEKLGDTDIDLSGYSTTTEMNTAIANAISGFKTEAQIRAIVEGYGYASQTSVNTALAGKVDKESGKGLSTNDYTNAEKTKLAGIEAGAEVNVLEELCLAETDHVDDVSSFVTKDTAIIDEKTGYLIVASIDDVRALFGF